MKIFLAYGNLEKELRMGQYLLEPVNNWLFSYAFVDQNEFKEVMNMFYHAQFNGREKHILIDSGAFTAFNTGQEIDLKVYAKWLTDQKKHWEHRVTSFHYMTLDVIGSQEQTSKNTQYLLSQGLAPIDIITNDSTDEDIIHSLSQHEYIALGGLVGAGLNRQISRLNHYFSLWEQHRKRTGKLVKTHLLGLCVDDILYKYPAYSCDMTSWAIQIKSFGKIPPKLGIFQSLTSLPKLKRSTGTFAATVSVIAATIEYYKQLEKDVTKAWARRGITWITK